mgnify:CR=1 FL=1|tara:strand:- start:1635 stop:2174 length:540 start_codon:yes stop_codon:yes gene_type:complete
MRETLYNALPLFDIEHIKKLNKSISNNLTKSTDSPSTEAIKTSQVKFVRLFSIQELIMPFLDFIITSNTYYYGFDLFPLTGTKIVNYNTYEKDEEYTWHIDASMKSPIKDIKLTCLLNCSEKNYEGGDLYLFRDGEVKVENFNPGSAVIFPSFINHKVEKIKSGSRATLSIWMNGPKFR